MPEPDFSVFSNFNKDAGYSLIRFGANGLMLEAELNELQQIQDSKLKSFLSNRFGDGFFKSNGSILTYSDGNVVFSSDFALADGDMVTITSLTLALAEGETAYLDVWYSDVTYQSTIKRFGNQQELAIIANEIKDSRVSEETTRRIQLQYDLVKSVGGAGHTYLPVCTVFGGNLIDIRAEINGGATIIGSGSVSKLYSSFTAVSDGTTNCLINQPSFSSLADVLDVFYEGVKQTPNVHYTMNPNGISIDLAFSINIGEIIRFEVLKNVSSQPPFPGVTNGWETITEWDIEEGSSSANIYVPSEYSEIEISLIDIVGNPDSASLYMRFNNDNTPNIYVYKYNGGSSANSDHINLSGAVNPLNCFIKATNREGNTKLVSYTSVFGNTATIPSSATWGGSDKISFVNIYLSGGSFASGKIAVKGYK